jgi:Cu/Ag efflux pump CusA
MAIGLSIDFLSLKAMMGTQSGDWWGPMAVAVIFGLAFATLLTLVFVPVAYSLLESSRAAVGRLVAFVLRRPKPAEAGAE